ncbi:hypothetical protein ACFU99_16725 [Streptomyces sp. NPDC057654]
MTTTLPVQLEVIFQSLQCSTATVEDEFPAPRVTVDETTGGQAVPGAKS